MKRHILVWIVCAAVGIGIIGLAVREHRGVPVTYDQHDAIMFGELGPNTPVKLFPVLFSGGL